MYDKKGQKALVKAYYLDAGVEFVFYLVLFPRSTFPSCVRVSLDVIIPIVRVMDESFIALACPTCGNFAPSILCRRGGMLYMLYLKLPN